MDNQQQHQQTREVGPKRAPSPSTLSTASSNSPLVRSGSSTSTSSASTLSGSLSSSSSSSASSSVSSSSKFGHLVANRRPAPTSIAAAQLQCQQQQQQLEFSNKLASPPGKHQQQHQHQAGAKLLAPSYHLGNQAPIDHKQQQQQHQRAATAGPKAAKQSNRCDQTPGAHKQQKKLEANGKSFSYNVAKSLAYRANRFNEFWSAHKMRYMNLACLLMTLVCLLTILLFSNIERSSSSGSNNNNAGHSLTSLKSRRNGLSLEQQPTAHGTNNQNLSPSLSMESIDSLDRQPLERRPFEGQEKPTTGSEGGGGGGNGEPSSSTKDSTKEGQDNTTDGFNLFDEHNSSSNNNASGQQAAGSKPSRVDQDDGHDDHHQEQAGHAPGQDPAPRAPAKTPAAGGQQNEREVEDTLGWPALEAKRRRIVGSSLLDPILSRVLDDLEGDGSGGGGSLFKTLELDGEDSDKSAQGSTRVRPLVARRTKDGAGLLTVIIRSSSSSSGGGLASNATTGGGGGGGNNTTNDVGPAEGASNSTSQPTPLALPSLLEKLLPPMLRPLALLGVGGSGSSQQVTTTPGGRSISMRGPNGFATITINSVEPQARGLSPFGPFPFAFGDPSPEPSSPFGSLGPLSSGPATVVSASGPFAGATGGSSSAPRPLVMSSSFARGDSMPPMMMLPPPLSLFQSMIQRASEMAQQELGGSELLGQQQQQQQQQQAGKRPNSTGAETLGAQASQQQQQQQQSGNQTVLAASNSTTPTNATTTSRLDSGDNEPEEAADEVETFDVFNQALPFSPRQRWRQSPPPPPQLLPFASLFSPSGFGADSPRPRLGSSMIVISSSASMPPPALAAPSAGHQQQVMASGGSGSMQGPQMMVLNGPGEPQGGLSSMGMGMGVMSMSPMLRSLLGSVDDQEPPFLVRRPAAIRRLWSMPNQAMMMESSSSSSGASNQQPDSAADQHQQQEQDYWDEPSSSSPPSLRPRQARTDQRAPPPKASQGGGRMVEVMPQAASKQQVAIEQSRPQGANPLEGVRSQSISRMDDNDDEEEHREPLRAHFGAVSFGGRPPLFASSHYRPNMFGGPNMFAPTMQPVATLRRAQYGEAQALRGPEGPEFGGLMLPPVGIMDRLFENIRASIGPGRQQQQQQQVDTMDSRAGADDMSSSWQTMQPKQQQQDSMAAAANNNNDHMDDDMDDEDLDEGDSMQPASMMADQHLAQLRASNSDAHAPATRPGAELVGPQSARRRLVVKFDKKHSPNKAGLGGQEGHQEEASSNSLSGKPSGSGDQSADQSSSSVNNHNRQLESKISLQSVTETKRAPSDQHRSSAAAAAAAKGLEASPFTSPSSPLFGFPSIVHRNDKLQQLKFVGPQADRSSYGAPERRASDLEAPATAAAAPNHRRPRTFAYHSNHEIAGTSQLRQPEAGTVQEGRLLGSVGELAPGPSARHFADEEPAATSLVMGRRLDDGPFATLHHHHHQDQQSSPNENDHDDHQASAANQAAAWLAASS